MVMEQVTGEMVSRTATDTAISAGLAALATRDADHDAAGVRIKWDSSCKDLRLG